MLKENKEPTMDVVVEIMKIQKVTPVWQNIRFV